MNLSLCAGLALLVPAQSGLDPLRDALTFHASFDRGADADFARGDGRIHTSPTGKLLEGTPGLSAEGVSVDPGAGKIGGALRFTKRTQAVVYFRAAESFRYRQKDWSATASFWLSLEPNKDLEPGYSDPIQITDKAWDKAAIFVDFTKDERPRHFRLGVFCDERVWNPSGRKWEEIPETEKPFVTVKEPPFAAGRWTHVAVTIRKFNSPGEDAEARLYLDGKLAGAIRDRPQVFTWDPSRAAVQIGMSYVGLFDELTLFDRDLSAEEVGTLFRLEAGASIRASAPAAAPVFAAELVFPLHSQHNHAPGIVECPNGDLFTTWYRGSGERRADDVAVWGARRRKGQAAWNEPMLLADVPGFPDCNTALWIDAEKRLWLFWPTIIANSWESCLTNYRVARDYEGDGPPRWDWQGVLFLQPQAFEETMLRGLEHRLAMSTAKPPEGSIEELKRRIADKLSSRLGWQPRSKPTLLPSGRIVLPLYSDTYSVSLMALSDDGGLTWRASRPLAGFGNIQPAVLRRSDGTLTAYMRENGPLNRVRVSESTDDGETWGPVGVTSLPNPGSGLDAHRLQSGAWILVYNDSESGRNSLAVSLSADEGRTWTWTRHIERQPTGSFHYPAVTQGSDGVIHAVYSYFAAGGKSMKHAAFNEAWLRSAED